MTWVSDGKANNESIMGSAKKATFDGEILRMSFGGVAYRSHWFWFEEDGLFNFFSPAMFSEVCELVVSGYLV